jgi:integrase
MVGQWGKCATGKSADAYVSRQLGHSSIQVTVDLYGHFIPGADRHHVESLAADIEAHRTQQDATPLQHDPTAQATRGV